MAHRRYTGGKVDGGDGGKVYCLKKTAGHVVDPNKYGAVPELDSLVYDFSYFCDEKIDPGCAPSSDVPRTIASNGAPLADLSDYICDPEDSEPGELVQIRRGAKGKVYLIAPTYAVDTLGASFYASGKDTQKGVRCAVAW